MSRTSAADDLVRGIELRPLAPDQTPIAGAKANGAQDRLLKIRLSAGATAAFDFSVPDAACSETPETKEHIFAR
jgi:hypothetical protein